ncbi:RNA polymerase III transcription factor TFIIIC subunit [Trichophyton interdigitale]|nr:RNA polymerase III transcription factor TFIIIC subunit [Trichophyton interdigitale]KAG5217401.1 RNA polymerase III transcription factor TFIIIC subunit [Trichophyton interdigitale]KAG8212432.1 RNA polymerase III transcription factor TFIIIC subunit [Trichophyton interdigitale]
METDPELLRWSSSKPSNNDTNDPGPSQLVTAKERDRGWPEESISSLSSEDDSLEGEIYEEEDYEGDNDYVNQSYDDDAVLARIARKSRRPGFSHGYDDDSVRRAPRRGPLKPVEPTAEFKNLQSEATSAFIDADYERALDLVKQAIHLNPEIFQAHVLLSEIFLAQGQKRKALYALFTGAHTRRKPEVWLEVANLILERADGDRAAALDDVVYCYSRVIDIDPKRYDIRFERAAINEELGYKGKAIQEYEKILEGLPHNTNALRSLAALYIELGEIGKARAHYERCISYYMNLNPEEVEDFTWSDVNIYVELFSYEHDYLAGISSLNSLARWLLGRKGDSGWDMVDDDREWDADDYPRRIATPWFVPGQYPLESYGIGLPLELRIKLGVYRLKSGYKDEALFHFHWLEPDDNSPGAKLFDYGDLFREAADSIKDIQLYEDALRFYIPLQHVQDFANTSLFLAMAECYDACGNTEETERCYLTVAEYDKTNIEARTKLAHFYEKMGMTDQALKFITEAADIGREAVLSRRKPRFGPDIGRLANHFRDIEQGASGSEDQVSPIESAVSSAAGDITTAEESTTIGFIPRSVTNLPGERGREIAPLKPDGENVRYLYAKMLELQPYMRQGQQDATGDWLDIAYALLWDFRSNRVFFPLQKKMTFLGYSREAQRKAGRLKSTNLVDELQEISNRIQASMGTPEIDASSIPNDYHGIDFDSWLDIFLEYALVLSGQGQGDEAYDTLGAAADASIWYHSKPSTLRIYICWFTCALRLKDEDRLSDISRWFMKEYQFVTDAYRLFVTLSRVCGNPQRSLFHSAPSMKFMLRQVKAVDYSLPPDPLSPFKRSPESIYQERASLTTKNAEGEYIPAEEMDVALLVLYGHILYAGNSFTNALNYFFRAYALDPENPAILLSIGLSYISHSLKRQSDNRHYLVMEGLSFMQEYRRIRSQSSILQERQEVEFNFARVWQLLGIGHLAVEGYQKCLEIGEEIETERQKAQNPNTGGGTTVGEQRGEAWLEDFSRQAAYALQCLYLQSGEKGLCKRVTEKWLVI